MVNINEYRLQLNQLEVEKKELTEMWSDLTKPGNFREFKEEEISKISNFAKKVFSLPHEIQESYENIQESCELKKNARFFLACLDYHKKSSKVFETVKKDIRKGTVNKLEEIKKYIKDTYLTQQQIFEIIKLFLSHVTFHFNDLDYYLKNKEQTKIFFDEFCNKFSEFGITDKNYQLEIAKIVGSKIDSEISKNLDHYGPFDQDQRFEIAKCVSLNDSNISKYIKLYDLSQTQNYEIAKICAMAQFRIPEFNILFCECVENYELKNDQAFEVAKISAKCNHNFFVCGGNGSGFIKLLNPMQLFEIAKIAAEHYGVNLTKTIKQYGKLSNLQLFELAKLAATSRVTESNYIRTTVHTALFQIQKNFGLSEDQLYEVIKIAAKYDGVHTCDFIRIDGKLKEDRFFEVAKIAVQQSGFITILQKEFDYERRAELIEIATPSIIKIMLSNLESSQFENCKYIIESVVINWSIYFEDYDLPEEFYFIDQEEPNLSWVPNKFKNILNEYLNEPKVSFWLACYLLRASINDKYKDREIELTNKNLLVAFAKLHNPQKRLQLTRLLFEQLCGDDKESFILYNKLGTHKFAQKYPLFRILFTSIIYAYGKEIGSTDWDIILQNWKSVFSILESSVYKDSRSQITIINSIYTIIKEKLPEKQKVDIILRIFSNIENKTLKERAHFVNKQLNLMISIIESGNVEKLIEMINDVNDSKFKGQIYLQDCLIKIFNSVMGEIELKNHAEKYDSHFNKSRDPSAFLVYANKIDKLSHSEMKQNMRDLYISILEDRLPELRYTSAPGDHLSTIFSWGKSLKETWIQGSYSQLLEEECSEKEEDSLTDMNVHRYLFQKICIDNHLSNVEFAILANYLKQKSRKKDEEKQSLSSGNKDKDPNKIQFQNELISFIEIANDPLKRRTALSNVIRLAKEILSGNHQFVRDLLDLEKEFQAEGKKIRYNGWRVVDTDNWEDLLLSGTEVIGSCQHIHGDVSLNKCLLNYIVDGKNRIVALKDAEGRIQARAIIRLLWDEKWKQPVLYRERVYKNVGVNEGNLKAIDRICLEKAKAMGIQLVRTKEEEEKAEDYFLGDLTSLNGRASFEYVDAGHLGITTGSYTIPASQVTRMSTWNYSIAAFLIFGNITNYSFFKAR